MKEFAFPVSVKCANNTESNQLLQLLYKLGYVHFEDKTNPFGESPTYITTGVCGISNLISIGYYQSTTSGVFIITDFNIDLINDIVSVRCGKTWVEGEPFVGSVYASIKEYGGIEYSAGEVISETCFRRPSIADICNHHGYYISGKDIIKKGYISNNNYSYNECNFNDYANSRIEKEAITMLRYVEAKTGCKYSLTKTETTETKLL